MVTEHGEMTITAVMDPEEPTQLGPNVMTLALSMGEMSVTNATITVVPTMPGHGAHGTNEVPVVTETGDGVYEVTNLVFTMPGTWQLEVRVVATDGMETNKHFAYTVR
jgi:methionine-rich copper-binding protein CopC|tara:strand:- start:60 stop:383 length:324 start_codon:yes stop_codon:yes gene_type:complete